MSELVSYTDYLVIATARNERQAKAIVDEVRLRLKRDAGLLPARAEGEGEARWVLLDYLDCVLHVQVSGDPRAVSAGAALGRGGAPRARSARRRRLSGARSVRRRA